MVRVDISTGRKKHRPWAGVPTPAFCLTCSMILTAFSFSTTLSTISFNVYFGEYFEYGQERCHADARRQCYADDGFFDVTVGQLLDLVAKHCYRRLGHRDLDVVGSGAQWREKKT